jgi:hypothetical protein
MTRMCLTAARLLLLAAMTAARAVKPTELTGVITQVTGAVRLSGPGVGDIPLASPWQALRGGVAIRVPAGGAAGIVCSNRRFVHIRGPVSWSLTPRACAVGNELAPADYALVVPQAGRFNVIHGFLVLDRKMRGNDGGDPLAPFVVSPRNSVLHVARPAVSWLRAPLATEYQVEWSGSGTGGYTTRLDASDVACATRTEGLDVCSLPWPADRSGLSPGETFFLKISARTGIAEPWHGNDPVEVRTLAVADAGKLESRLGDLAALGLEGAALDTARASALAGEGLYVDAADACRRALAAAPSPELRVTLADIELAMGLHRLAEPLYRQALGEGDPAVRAAAAFGLGRLLYAGDRYGEAAAAFRQARGLYAGLKLAEEEAAARQAAAKAAARALE